jgi:hypothetical protein
MDPSENDFEALSDGPDEVERWGGLRDAARQALATAEYPPGATPWAEIPPFQQAMLIGIKMAHEDEDFRKEVAKHLS